MLLKRNIKINILRLYKKATYIASLSTINLQSLQQRRNLKNHRGTMICSEKMKRIEHKFVKVNGLNLHIAEAGMGPQTVVLLHGFPEIWYSWRHQMLALADAGFRVIAPDSRGYGLSDPPPVPKSTCFNDMIDDLRAILDHFGLAKAFLVAKDSGALTACMFAFQYPERVSALVTLGAPVFPSGPVQFHNYMPEGFYISRWQKPGRAEADFGRFDTKTVVKNIYTLFSGSEIPIAPEDKEIMDLVDPSTALPPWLTEEDLAVYGSLYKNSGFETALQVPYRTIGETDNSSAPEVTEFKVPSLLIMGDKDFFLKFPGIEDYIRSGKLTDFAPNCEVVHMPEGSHFVQEQFPQEVNQLILNFLKNRL